MKYLIAILFTQIVYSTDYVRLIDTEDVYSFEAAMNNEENDCTVRAVAEAFDLTYGKSLRITKEWGRESKQGMTMKAFLKGLRDTFRYNIVYGSNVREGMTSEEFYKEVVKDGFGYIVLTFDHVYVIEQGRKGRWYLKGNHNDRSKQIFAYIQIKL